MSLRKRMYHVTVKLINDLIVSCFIEGKNRTQVNSKLTNCNQVKEILSTSNGTVARNRKKNNNENI